MLTKPISALLILCLATEHLLACGSWFPNRLLDHGGAKLLIAPVAAFVREIEAMKLVTPTHIAVMATNGFVEETADAELADLRRALANKGRTGAEIDGIVREHQNSRDKLKTFVEQLDAWRQLPPPGPGGVAVPPPALVSGTVRVAATLPAEFADYFRGAIAWHSGDTNSARAAWEALLKRPPAERRFRSTWAAFMLGKAAWETLPGRAVKHFQQVRALAKEGFADSLGLAASSLGWEARIELRREGYIRAIELYLDQAAGGDGTAYNSLRYTAALAVRHEARALKPLAAHPRAQRVITAWMISGGWREPPVDVDGPVKEPILRLLSQQSLVGPPRGGWHSLKPPVLLWLEAVEAAKVRDVESAEKLALAAYQAGEMDTARRWIDHAPASPTAQWLQAKLLLRDGRIDDAAAILTKLARLFPPSYREATNTAGAAQLQQRLYGEYGPFRITPAPTQVLGELGSLRLARREYSEALDALLRSGYWEDASYVADRVLTLDELKAYVDRRWPGDVREQTREERAAQLAEPHAEESPGTLRANIRHLLAQRLVRAGRHREARDYFAVDAGRMFDAYLAAVASGRNDERPPADRAASLWTAAQLVAGSGLSVFNAPAETDWRIRDGLFTYSFTPPARVMAAEPFVLPLSFEERLRVVQTAVYPVRNWYYRFAAAAMAWEAACLMPDNSAETARVLCEAGTWIKYVDPKAADRFYKALVRRCPKTALGQEAARKRWFPISAEAGQTDGPRAAPAQTER